MFLIIIGILTYIALEQTGVPFSFKVFFVTMLVALILWILFGPDLDN